MPSATLFCRSSAFGTLRFEQLRRDKVHEKCFFPKRRPRHEKIDLREMVRRCEEDYIDFQDATWQQPGFTTTTATTKYNENVDVDC